MGAIRPIKLANGNDGLEITYGGKESPFGGVDTSAPPAYIASNCFAAADGFLVVDNKLVAASLQPLSKPTTLWGNVDGVTLLAFGTFYQTGYGQLNYALGYTAIQFGTPTVSPTGVNYTFYMTTWNPSTPTVTLSNTELELTLFDSYLSSTQSSITLDCIGTGAQSNPTATSATVNILTVHSIGSVNGYIQTNADLTITGGVGYSAGEFITIAQGTWFGAVVQVLTVDGGGGILTWNLVAQAWGYTVGPATAIPYVNTPTVLTIVGPAGSNTYSVGSTTYTTLTRTAVVTAMVAAINAGPDPNVQAAPTPDGYAIILTAINPGALGNTITVQDSSADYSSILPPIFYFAARQPDNLSGGQDLVSVVAPRFFTTASIANVGGTLYIGNLGPMILKYTEPAIFKTSTMYQGVDVLRKFAGSLIGLRLQPQLGTLVQDSDMVFAWTAGENLDEWAPATTAGLVTGAGFEQLADIGDYLTGLIVSNGTAFIIRAQGISYATPTGNASLPFTVAHIGLGDKGEGSQLSNLIAQYDQTGVYVGGSNVYQISGQISAIGDKIKAGLFQDLNSVLGLGSDNLIGAAACSVFVGGDEFPLIVLAISTFYSGTIALKSYIFNPTNGTWMPFSYANGSGIGAIQTAIVSPLATLATGPEDEIFNQTIMAYGFQQEISSTPSPPTFFALQEGVKNSTSISNQAGIAFPQEEIMFGRDITIDSLYLSLWANVSENTSIDWYLNGVLYATLVLDAATYNSLSGNPIELQLFPLSGYGAGAQTGKSPQLTFKVRSLTDTGTAQIRFSKIMMLASFDPAQRPT